MDLARSLSLRSLLVFCVAATADCSCNDSLTVAQGEIALSLCDRSEACGCFELQPEAVLDFGAPAVGSVARRTFRIRNLNPTKALVVRGLALTGNDGSFGITALQKHTPAQDGGADVVAHDLSTRVLELVGDEYAEVSLAFQPREAGSVTATLAVQSDSSNQREWRVALRGGSASATVCHEGGGSSACGSGIVVDFGTYHDHELSSAFDQARPVTLTNTGEGEVFVNVELTADGIAEQSPSELVGAHGVFSLETSECLVLAPGEATEVLAHYRPFTAGQHQGEFVVNATGEPVVVSLVGKVVGAHICFRTEDGAPSDATLQFGDPPYFQTRQTTTEARRIWVQSCGYEASLELEGATFVSGSSDHFEAALAPVTGAVLEVGEELELEVEYRAQRRDGALLRRPLVCQQRPFSWHRAG